jgi:hypothetical protein
MTPSFPRSRGPSLGTVIVILLGGVALDVAANRAEAQWYPGIFWGDYTPPSVDFINRQAIENIANIQANQAPAGVPAAQSNSYTNQTRDPEFFEKYDIETRRAMEDRVARHPRQPQAKTKAAIATPNVPVAPVVPIATFFDKYNVLVWPGDAPTSGELGPKRVVSDKASLVVLGETKQRGVAAVATVTEARKKLLDYGKPALAYVSANLTPRVTDAFHLFLLSLYESLQQAATPPKGTPPPAR